MAKYKVISLGVSGTGNRFFGHGEVKDESCFSNVDELVKSEHLELVNDQEQEEQEKREVEHQDQDVPDEQSPLDLLNDASSASDKKDYGDITVKELREITGETSPKLKKQDLYEMYLDLA